MPELFDPKNKELEYYNDRDEDEKRRRPLPRMKSIFATRPFMFGYAAFLTIMVLIIIAYQRGGISNIPVISRYFGEGISVKSKIVKEKDEKYILVSVKNTRYKYDNIMNFQSIITLYNKETALDSTKTGYTDINFPKGSSFEFIIDFPKESMEKADRFIVLTKIDNVFIENKVPLY